MLSQFVIEKSLLTSTVILSPYQISTSDICNENTIYALLYLSGNELSGSQLTTTIFYEMDPSLHLKFTVHS